LRYINTSKTTFEKFYKLCDFLHQSKINISVQKQFIIFPHDEDKTIYCVRLTEITTITSHVLMIIIMNQNINNINQYSFKHKVFILTLDLFIASVVLNVKLDTVIITQSTNTRYTQVNILKGNLFIN